MKLGKKKGHGRETEINRQTDALVDGWTEMSLAENVKHKNYLNLCFSCFAC